MQHHSPTFVVIMLLAVGCWLLAVGCWLLAFGLLAVTSYKGSEVVYRHDHGSHQH